MSSVFDYVFNIGGNFSAKINGMSAATGAFSAQVDGAQNSVQKFTAACMTLDYAKNVAQSMADGFSELISAALQQCGMAAKAANVSFEETNAAIQVLDKAGKKASEGGVALRNVLGQLSKGRFVEKQAAEELEKVGIDVVALGDSSKSLKERLEMLKPMLSDSALLSEAVAFHGYER